MMKLERIHNEVIKELGIDMSNLDYESLRTHELYIKYLKMHSLEKIKLAHYNNELNIEYKNALRFYSGKSTVPFDEFVDKADMKHYIYADEKYINSKNKVTMQQEVVIYLEKLLKQISDRNWSIRNALEDIKFKNGG